MSNNVSSNSSVMAIPVGDPIVPQPDDSYTGAIRTGQIVGECTDRFTKPVACVASQCFLEFNPSTFRAFDQARQLFIVQT